MGWLVGLPSLKLNLAKVKSKHCGNFYLVAAEALEERLGLDADIDPSLAHKNIYYGYKTAKELLAYSARHCKELEELQGRAIRADAVRMCVTIFKPPAAYMQTLTYEEQVRILDDAVELIAKLVGAENVKSYAYHFDEQGGHVHIFWEPMTPDGRLCAKEMHSRKFLSQLNREMPAHLRSRGWDIDDCQVYDQAQMQLMSEKEKAERRRKNGRSSAVYKADAERELNVLSQSIDMAIDNLERQLSDYSKGAVEHVLNESSGVYDNVLFLMCECDDQRFNELDNEGRLLKATVLENQAEQCRPEQSIRSLVERIENAEKRKEALDWKEREQFWKAYREISKCFWELHAELKAEYVIEVKNAYQKRRRARHSYYDSIYYLSRSRGWLSLFIALIRLGVTAVNKKIMENKVERLREEQKQLIANTATFYKYSNSYRDLLKEGKRPLDKHLDGMVEIVRMLDEEADRVWSRTALQKLKDGRLRFGQDFSDTPNR